MSAVTVWDPMPSVTCIELDPTELPGICCKSQDIYNYFPPVDTVSFCLRVSTRKSKNAAVCEREKVEILICAISSMMTYVCRLWKKVSLSHRQCVTHFFCNFLSFFPLWGSDTSNKAALSDLHISRDGRIWSRANRNIYLFPQGACLAEWPYLVAGLRALIESDCLSNRILGLLVPS